MEPIILKFNETNFNAFCRKVEKAKEAAQKFFDSLNDICRMEISTDLLEDVLFSNGEAIAKAIERQISAELDRAKISSTSIKESAVKADLEKFYTLLKSFQQPDGQIGRIFVVKAGKVEIKENAFEEAKERFTYKITTERGKQLYEAQKDAVKALQRFFEIANPKIYEVNRFAELFAYDWEKKTISANQGVFGLDYDRIAKKPERETAL